TSTRSGSSSTSPNPVSSAEKKNSRTAPLPRTGGVLGLRTRASVAYRSTRSSSCLVLQARAKSWVSFRTCAAARLIAGPLSCARIGGGSGVHNVFRTGFKTKPLNGLQGSRHSILAGLGPAHLVIEPIEEFLDLRISRCFAARIRGRRLFGLLTRIFFVIQGCCLGSAILFENSP